MRPHVWLTQIGMTIISAAPILRDPAMEKKNTRSNGSGGPLLAVFLFVCLFFCFRSLLGEDPIVFGGED